MPKESTYLRVRRLYRVYRANGGDTFPILILGRNELKEVKEAKSPIYYSIDWHNRTMCCGLYFTKVIETKKNYFIGFKNIT